MQTSSESKLSKELEALNTLYKEIDLDLSTQKDVNDEKDEELIKNIKEKYNIENVDDNIIMLTPQFVFAHRFRIATQYISGKESKEFLEIDNSTFSRYKTGSQFPEISTIIKLAQKLQISPFYLLGLTSYPTLAVDEINKILGLSETSMKILFMLNHDVGECKEITDNIPVSSHHKTKLNLLNSFIENNVIFLKFLSRLEQYTKLKEKQSQNSNEDIEFQLLRVKRRNYTYIVRILR